MAIKFQGGRAVPVDPAAKQAASESAGRLDRAASDVSAAVNRLKRFVPDNPNLQSLIAEGDQLRQRLFDLGKKIQRA